MSNQVEQELKEVAAQAAQGNLITPPPPAATGPRIQRRENWVELPSEYEGFKFRMWVNAPTKLWLDVNSGNEVRSAEALRQIVIEHNGWVDFDGQPYPAASDSKFWAEIPTELATVILMSCQVEMAKLPNSLAPTKRR